MRRSLSLALVAALLAVFAAACSKSTPAGASSATNSTTYPLTITAANGAVTIKAKPVRIVSLSPTATEMLFAIGAGSQVIAVDDQSNYPTQAPKTKLSSFQPNVEAVAGYQPDLVVTSADVAGLKALSIPELVEPAAKDLNDSYSQITQLGTATGHTAEASAVTTSMKTQIQTIVASAPHFQTPPTYYHELDNTFYTATSSTFIGKVYSLLGLKNIADPADKKASGYPQLSQEYIIQADPTLIFLADTKCCGQTAQTVGKRPGWKGIAAVKNGDVIGLDDDIASRWGPRVVDFVRQVADALKTVKVN
jgi:iron complex transport system substrate-binding protein